MKRILLAGAAMLGLCTLNSTADAALITTGPNFINLTTPSTITFTYEGYRADDRDGMRLAFGGTTIFFNKTTALGDSVTTETLAAGLHKLELDDATVAASWFSDPALNTDHAAHLASTTTFSDFHLGSAPVSAPIYYGWEDRAFPASDGDYNDLVFTLKINCVPEPTSLAIAGIGLIALGAARRRRNA